MEHLAARLAQIPGVVAVTLGGSRARGEARPSSDWDFGIYYRDHLDPADVVALGWDGHVVPPGAWGRLVNGGAWLTVEGQNVDLLYREVGFVTTWVEEAEAGRFEVDLVGGYLAGMATYVLAGELALARVLYGQLPRPAFPAALRHTAPPWWRGNAAFSLVHADGAAARDAVVECSGQLARAAMAVAQARLAERGEWALSEKGILQRASLAQAEEVLASPGQRADELARSVARMRRILQLGRPTSRQVDAVVS